MKITPHELPRSYWRHVAERNGIRAKTFDIRIGRGWPASDAATRPVRQGTWATMAATRERARQAGLPEDAVSRYRHRNGGAPGMTDSEIIEHLRNYHANSVRAMAERAGINHKALEWRLQAGWPLERALSEPINPAGSTIYENRKRRGEAR